MKFKTILTGALLCTMSTLTLAQETPSDKVTNRSNGNRVKISSNFKIAEGDDLASFIDSLVGITDQTIQRLQQQLENIDVQEIHLDSLDKVLKQITIRIGDSTEHTYRTGDKILLGIMIDDYSNTQDLKMVHPVVSNVIENSPAFEAGLQKNDAIFKLDGEEVNLISDITSIITTKSEGDSLVIDFIRNADTLQTVAHLRLVPKNDSWITFLNSRLAPLDSINKTLPFCEKIIIQKSGPRLGVSVRDLDDEARKSLKVKKGGALITSVIGNTTAEAMHLQINDVITVFNGQEIDNVAELKELVDHLSIPNEVVIKYVRYGKKKTAKGVISEFSKAWDENNTMNVIDLSQFFQDK